jgi:hypothetical protein
MFVQNLLFVSTLICLNLSTIHSLKISCHRNTVEPDYNDIGLYVTSPMAPDILLYQLIHYCQPLHYVTRLE